MDEPRPQDPTTLARALLRCLGDRVEGARGLPETDPARLLLLDVEAIADRRRPRHSEDPPTEIVRQLQKRTKISDACVSAAYDDLERGWAAEAASAAALMDRLANPPKTTPAYERTRVRLGVPIDRCW